MSNTTSSSNIVPFRRIEDERPSYRPNLIHYQGLLEENGLTPEQKIQFLEALWTLISGFIDLGYGLHPIQHPQIPDDLDTIIIQAVEGHFRDAA